MSSFEKEKQKKIITKTTIFAQKFCLSVRRRLKLWSKMHVKMQVFCSFALSNEPVMLLFNLHYKEMKFMSLDFIMGCIDVCSNRRF